MATLVTKPVSNHGVNFAKLDIRDLVTYEYGGVTKTGAAFGDDESNYTQFFVSGFKYVLNGGNLVDVTGGTVTSFKIVAGGVTEYSFTGLNISAAKLFDFYVAQDAKGALAYALSGNDTINGTVYADVMSAGSGNDSISGAGGNDTLRGDAGIDKVYGGAGADKLYGGTGADTFVFKSIADSTVASAGRDMIYDFSRSQNDKIGLSAIDANSKLANDQAFTFIGTDGFHKIAGELRFVKSGGDTFVHGDVNGDGKSDFSIVIDANVTLKATDFIL